MTEIGPPAWRSRRAWVVPVCECGHERGYHGDCTGPCRRNDCDCRSYRKLERSSDLEVENQRLREELRLREESEIPVRHNAASADPVFGGVGREGMVTVWDAEGRYVGCMGVNLWRDLLTVSGGPIDG